MAMPLLRRLAVVVVCALLACLVAGPMAQPDPAPRAPAFAEAWQAEVEQRVVKQDDKGGVAEGEVHEATLYYDHKRQAERIDVHTFATSYLFLYSKALAYMTNEHQCFTAVLSKPQIAPRLGAAATFVGTEDSINEVDGVERWQNAVPAYGTLEELWVKRGQGNAAWPVRERFYRDLGKGKEMVVDVDYLDFVPGRQDPQMFRPPPSGCVPFPGEEFARALEHRNTLHFNPLHSRA